MLIKNCKVCSKEYVCSNSLQTTCCFVCWKILSMKKKGKTDSPKYKQYMARRPKGKKDVKPFAYISKEFRAEYVEKHGSLFCEVCGIKNAHKYDVHHVVFRSQLRGHPDMHNYRNLMLLCSECHRKVHRDRKLRLELVQRRKLWEIYDVAKRYMP